MNRIICFLSFALLAGCSEGISSESLSSLQKTFPAKEKVNQNSVSVDSITIFSKSNRTTNRFRNIASYKLTPSLIEIKVDSLSDYKLQIPVSEISGCEKTCFGSKEKYWSADLLLGKHGTEISFEHASEILSWCYDTGLPIISKEEKRNWMDRGGDLPTYEDYKQIDKAEYEKQYNKRCKGY